MRGLFLGEIGIPSEQISFTDVEDANRRRVSRCEQFLETMDATIPWSQSGNREEEIRMGGIEHTLRPPRLLFRVSEAALEQHRRCRSEVAAAPKGAGCPGRETGRCHREISGQRVRDFLPTSEG